jgi:hypothetical protein
MATWVEFATTRSRTERLRAAWQRRMRLLRRALDRLAPRLYLFLAALLLVVSKADLRLVHWLAGVVSDVYAPALSVLQQPVRLTQRIGEEIGALLALRSENARLKAELAELPQHPVQMAAGFGVDGYQVAVWSKEFEIRFWVLHHQVGVERQFGVGAHRLNNHRTE